jgi:hypothetical protein
LTIEALLDDYTDDISITPRKKKLSVYTPSANTALKIPRMYTSSTKLNLMLFYPGQCRRQSFIRIRNNQSARFRNKRTPFNRSRGENASRKAPQTTTLLSCPDHRSNLLYFSTGLIFERTLTEFSPFDFAGSRTIGFLIVTDW